MYYPLLIQVHNRRTADGKPGPIRKGCGATDCQKQFELASECFLNGGSGFRICLRRRHSPAILNLIRVLFEMPLEHPDAN